MKEIERQQKNRICEENIRSSERTRQKEDKEKPGKNQYILYFEQQDILKNVIVPFGALSISYTIVN